MEDWKKLCGASYRQSVLQLLLPVIEQAMQELPKIVQALQLRYGISEKEGIGLFGFSAGGIAALLTLIESSLTIKACVLAGVTKDLESAVNTYERATKQYYSVLKEQFPWMSENDIPYNWSDASLAARHRLNFVARTAILIQRQPIPAVLFVHGVQDEAYAVTDIEELYHIMIQYYEQAHQPERLFMKTFAHLGHQLDLEAAKNSPGIQHDLTQLQQFVTKWFSEHLS